MLSGCSTMQYLRIIEKVRDIMQTTVLQIPIDEELRAEADSLFSDLGLDTPTAMRIFLKQAVYHNGFPFEVRRNQPNAETLAAMEETDEIIRKIKFGEITPMYHNVAELMADLESEDDDADDEI